MKVISYSLWGNTPKYINGVIANYNIWLEHFQDRELWIYHDSSISQELMDRMPKARWVTMNDTVGIFGTTWRFTAIDEADEVWFRDVDSILTTRNNVLDKLWKSENVSLGIIRDHLFPNNIDPIRRLIRAGCFNLRGCMNGKMQQLINDYSPLVEYGDDELFLGRTIYPYFEDDMTIIIRGKEWQKKYSLDNHKFDNKEYVESPETADAGRQGIVQ